MTSQGQRFRRRALRRGYKVDEVDQFLDRVEATLNGERGHPPVASHEVRDVVFRVRFGGYDEWQVDLHLDRVERQLADQEPAAANEPRPERSLRDHPGERLPERVPGAAGMGGPSPMGRPPVGPPAGGRVPGGPMPGGGMQPGSSIPAGPMAGGPGLAAAGMGGPSAGGPPHGGPGMPPPPFDRDRPPSGLPQREVHPGGMPPGAMPPGAMPPGAMPPGGLPQRDLPPRGVSIPDDRMRGQSIPNDDRMRGQSIPNDDRMRGQINPEERQGLPGRPGTPPPGWPEQPHRPAPSPGFNQPAYQDRSDRPMTGPGEPLPQRQQYSTPDYGNEPTSSFPGFEVPRRGDGNRGDMTGEIRPGDMRGPSGPPAPAHVPPSPAQGMPSRMPPPQQPPHLPAAPPVGGMGGSSMPSAPTGEVARIDQIRRTFQVRRFGSGYDPGEVNRLFEGILSALSGRSSTPINESELDPQQFSLVPGGYFEAEVDQALREVRDILRRR